ncbi:Unknown protein, partial [Striga hermonthica]
LLAIVAGDYHRAPLQHLLPASVREPVAVPLRSPFSDETTFRQLCYARNGVQVASVIEVRFSSRAAVQRDFRTPKPESRLSVRGPFVRPVFSRFLKTGKSLRISSYIVIQTDIAHSFSYVLNCFVGFRVEFIVGLFTRSICRIMFVKLSSQRAGFLARTSAHARPVIGSAAWPASPYPAREPNFLCSMPMRLLACLIGGPSSRMGPFQCHRLVHSIFDEVGPNRVGHLGSRLEEVKSGEARCCSS